MKRWLWCLTCVASLAVAGCAKQMPRADLGALDPGLLSRCEAKGALVVEDQRYEDYWARNYDTFKVARLRQAGTTATMTVPDPLRRRVIKILSREGAEAVSTFDVVHYREQMPPVEVRAWTADGTARAVNVDKMGSRSMVDWPCQSMHPRLATFRVGPLNPGDTIEILHPLSGPEQEQWRFADERFCTLRSTANFGHAHDSAIIRLPMDAVIHDATDAVRRTSADGAHPKVYALTRPLEPLPADKVPFLVRSRRCRGWLYLHGKVFHAPIWMARDGSLPGGEGGVPAELTAEVAANAQTARIRAVAGWIAGITVDKNPVSYWLRWLPHEPAHKVAHARHGSTGGIAALAFRILEEAGMKPRYAALHTDDSVPFVEGFASPIAFDTLAVVVADAAGTDHWIVPGIKASDAPVPPVIQGRKALLMKRWVAERITGGGSCFPHFDMIWSCYNAAKALDAMDLITVGQ